MWKWITELFVGLFRGWLSEHKRDKAHEDLGEANANLKHEQDSKKKIAAADRARHGVSSDELLDDKNNRDN